MKALLLTALLATTNWAGATKVALKAEEGTYRLSGRFDVAAPPEIAWQVVTDYDGIGGFVSSIKRSKVLERGPGAAVLEQQGTGRFLFVSKDVTLKLAVKETPPQRVEFRDLGGADFSLYEGSWTIRASVTGCEVSYELTARPESSLGPGFAAKSALKRSAQRLLDEVRREIARRAGTREESHEN